MMIKKHEDFDKAIGNQEEKIESLQTYADQLIVAEHYAGSDIEDKKKEVNKQLFKIYIYESDLVWETNNNRGK